jgi:hypothetical protein
MKSILRLIGVIAVTALIVISLTACGGGGGAGGGGNDGGGGNGGGENSVEGHAFLSDSTDHSGITVSLEGTSYSTITDTTGYYYISNFPDGTYYIVASKSGYSDAKSGPWSFSYTHHGNIDLNLAIEEGSGEIVKIEQSDTLPYSYYYYVPASALNKALVALVLVATAGPNPGTSYAEVEDYALVQLNHLLPYAEPSGLIMFTVAIPAGMEGIDWDQTGSAQILHCANFETAVGMYFRPDLKFLDVFSHFKALLADAGFVVDPQIFVTGFSSGGMWTNRFALLYPELIKAVAPGAAGGIWTMPLESYEGTSLRYHIGIQDIETLGLEPFDVDNFIKIPFFVFTGAEDQNDALDCGEGHGCSGLNWDEIVFYKSAFGDTVVERAQSFHNQLIALGMNSTFWSYDGVGHEWSEDMKTDIINFFSSLPLTSPEP